MTGNFVFTETIVEKHLSNLRKAVNYLSDVIYNERDDEDSLDIAKGFCKIGMCWQLLIFIHDDLNQVSIPGIDNDDIKYHIVTVISHCENMAKNARTDMDNVDLLKLGDLIGASRQIIYEVITELQRLIPPNNSVNKTTDQLKAEATIVKAAEPPETYLFGESVKKQQTEWEVLPPKTDIDS